MKFSGNEQHKQKYIKQTVRVLHVVPRVARFNVTDRKHCKSLSLGCQHKKKSQD